MSAVPDLSLNECRLLRPEDAALVDAFNRVASLARRLAQAYPAFIQDLAPYLPGLVEVRERLTRTHYRVGFLGTTQAGKSTTFNNVLQVSEEESPAFSGKGEATTSAVTRLRRKDFGGHRLELVYLTPAQFQTKRSLICNAVEVNELKKDAEIQAELAARRAAISAGTSSDLENDVNALDRFLESYNAFGGTHVKEPALHKSPPYTERKGFLNHPTAAGQKPQPSPNLLLSEAHIDFVTSHIPPSLEMIDLPGLGSQGIIDSLLTFDFLRQLDGALIFLRADQIGDANAEQILAKLKPIFEGRWQGRIWIVITKFDVLNKPAFQGHDTWFDTVSRFLESHKFSTDPVVNLCITSNSVYDALTDHAENGRKDLASVKLGRSIDDPVYKRYPRFQSQLAELYSDGGISSLRQLVTSRLADSVSQEIRLAAEIRLAKLEQQLKHVEEGIQRRLSQTDEEFAQAKRCRIKVNDLLIELGGRPLYLDKPTQDFHEALKKIFDDRTLPVHQLNQLNIERLEQEEFIPTSQRLDSQLANLLAGNVIDPLYNKIGEELQGLPPVPMAEGRSALEAWEKYHEADRKDSDWLRRFPRFQSADLFTRLKARQADRRGFDGQSYRDILEGKIRLVSNQAVHAVCNRLKYRLYLLQRDLMLLTRETPSGNGA